MEAKDTSDVSAGIKQTIWCHSPKVQKHFFFKIWHPSCVQLYTNGDNQSNTQHIFFTYNSYMCRL